MLSCLVMTQDALSDLRIQNAKDAYIALFNALGPNHYATLKASFELASALLAESEGREDEAYQYAKSAYQALRSRTEELDTPLAYIADEYLYSMAHSGRSEEYLSVYRDVMDDCGGEERLKENFFDIWLNCQLDMSDMMRTLGNDPEAIRLLRQALKGCEREYGFAERQTLSTLMQLLAVIRLHQGMSSDEEAAEKEISRFSSRWMHSGEDPEIRPILVGFIKAAFSEKELSKQAIAKVDRQMSGLDQYSQMLIYPLIEFMIDIICEPEEEPR